MRLLVSVNIAGWIAQLIAVNPVVPSTSTPGSLGSSPGVLPHSQFDDESYDVDVQTGGNVGPALVFPQVLIFFMKSKTDVTSPRKSEHVRKILLELLSRIQI